MWSNGLKKLQTSIKNLNLINTGYDRKCPFNSGQFDLGESCSKPTKYSKPLSKLSHLSHKILVKYSIFAVFVRTGYPGLITDSPATPADKFFQFSSFSETRAFIHFFFNLDNDQGNPGQNADTVKKSSTDAKTKNL